MSSSLKDQLKVLAPYVPTDLVATAAWSNIYTLAQILPPVSYALLESRLGTSTSRVDLSVFLSKPTINLPEPILINPVWKRFQDLGEELSDTNSSLHEIVSDLWLEFDVDEQSLKVPIPCIGLGLNQKTACNFQSLLETAIKLLEHPITSDFVFNLQLCLDALPAEARIICMGVMLSRQSDAVRMIVSGIRPDELSVYLAQIGWTGSVNELDEVIFSLSSFVDNIVLSFDVGDTIFPRIGLECYLLEPQNKEPRWHLFLEHLVKTELCTPAKRNALLGWLESDPKALSIFGRLTTLIKIVYQPGIPLEAKAYLGFGHD
jgi:hypothetical protein